MNFIKQIFRKLFPIPNGKVESPPIPEKEELQFRVVTHFKGSDYYSLQYKGKWGWEKVTELWESYNGDSDDLNHPVLSKNFDELVAMGKKFKTDPSSFEAYKQNQIDRYNKRQAARAQEIREHDSREKYI